MPVIWVTYLERHCFFYSEGKPALMIPDTTSNLKSTQPDKQKSKQATGQDRIGPHDLFSLFTASIIKKKVSFTR
jgi:hypothetical protein